MEGKIGGDSLLSPRGMQYAKALPALVTDNIGDAPLTVGDVSPEGHYGQLTLALGVDVNAPTNDTDRTIFAISQAHLEIAGRIRCR